MGVRPGYKQTEVGVIPEDWEVRQLRECLSMQPTYGINAPAAPYSDRLPAYIRITDITEDGRYSSAKPVSVNSAASDAYYLIEGDIVFARTGASVGKSYLYDPKDGKLVFAGFLIRVGPNAGKLLSSYLSAYVTTGAYWNWVRLMSMRSGQPGINGQEYGQLPIPLPPLAEQRAIAEALSDVDGMLAALDRLIAKKRDLKQAAMQQLLTGPTRLPGFHGEWEMKRLGSEIADLVAGVSVNSVAGEVNGDNSGGAILKTSAVAGGVFKPTEAKIIASKDLRRVHLSPLAETVLISRMNTIEFVGECGYVPADFPNLFIPDRLWMTRFRSGTVLSPKWLSYVLCTPSARMLLRNIATGTSGSMKNISKAAFLNLEFRMPSLPEQTAIAEVLNDMDAELAALEQRREKTRLLKQAMMQELLTGRTRLVPPGGRE